MFLRIWRHITLMLTSKHGITKQTRRSAWHVFVVLGCLSMLLPNPTDITPQAALERLFTSDSLQEAWFSQAFRTQVPLARVAGILAQLSQQLGRFVRIEGAASPFTAVFAQGTTTAEITLDADRRIVRLLMHSPTPTLGSLTEAIAKLRALPGDVGVLVMQDGKEVTSSPWLKPGVSHPWGEHQMLCLLRRHLLTSPWLKPGASRRTW
jgi:hypothetical protein